MVYMQSMIDIKDWNVRFRLRNPMFRGNSYKEIDSVSQRQTALDMM
jgi:hypothetical protein